MKKCYLLPIWVILCLTMAISQCQTCHYSCSTCLPESIYTFCTSCKENQTLTVLNDPNNLDSDFRQSSVSSGLCTGQADPATQLNILGIFLLITCILVCAVTRTSQALYVFMTLQTLALISFLEVAYLAPTQYLMNALQYLLIFNIMAAGPKASNDYQFTIDNFYKLDQFFIETGLAANLLLVGSCTLIVFILLLIVLAFKKVRQRAFGQTNPTSKDKAIKSKLNEIQIPEDSGPRQDVHEAARLEIPLSVVSDPVLDKIQIVLITVFFFLIQEMVLVLVVISRFRKDSVGLMRIIVISAVYAICVIYVLCRVYWISLPYFANNYSMYINFFKKAVFPVLVIAPIHFQFILFIAMILTFFIESFVDLKGKLFSKSKRWVLYKIVEFVLILVALAYYVVDRKLNSQAASAIVRLVFGIVFAIAIIGILVQGCFGVYQTFFAKENSAQGQQLSQNLSIESKRSQKSGSKNYNKDQNIFHNQGLNQTEEEILDLDRNKTFDFAKGFGKTESVSDLQEKKRKGSIHNSSNGLQFQNGNDRDKQKRQKGIAQIEEINEEQDRASIEHSKNNPPLKIVYNSNKNEPEKQKNQQNAGENQQSMRKKADQEGEQAKNNQNKSSEQPVVETDKEKKARKLKAVIDRQLRMRYGIK